MAFNEEILHRKEPFNIADLQYDNRIEVVKLSCWIINLSLAISFLYNRDIADVLPHVLSSGSSLIRESPIFQTLNTIPSFSVVQNKDNKSGLAIPLLSSSEPHWKQFVDQFSRYEFPVSMQKFDITYDAIADLGRSLTDRETRVLLIPTYVTHPDGENA